MKRAMVKILAHSKMIIMASSLPAGQAGMWQLKIKL
jgi:hypothetical protein